MCCGTRFAQLAGLFDSGKHHCRLLGLLVCSGCSAHRAVLKAGEAPARVCDAAHSMLRTLEAEIARDCPRSLDAAHPRGR